MWHAFEIAWEVLELIASWRLLLCVIVSLAVGALVSWLYPASTGSIFVPAAIVGSVVGLAWELTILFTRRNSW